MSVAVDTRAAPTTTLDTATKVDVLSIRQLMWLRFKRNRLALFGARFLIFMYLVALFASFLAPYAVRTTHDEYASAAPHVPRFFDEEGNFHPRPFVYGLQPSIDPKTFRKIYTPLPEEIYPLRFFAKGIPYKFLGLFKTDYHLFTVEEPGKIFLLGTDRQGRDLFSRILFGAQVSLTVGLVGVLLSLVIGTILGVASGYFGGAFDSIVQRVIEVMLAFPQIPLWLALASLVPPTWSSVQVFFGISVVLSLVNWGGLARQVRGMVYALREEDYVTRHLLPNTLSHVLVVATLSIPSMILGETALSFLGLGIRPPMTSWGLLLNEAQHVRVLLQQPWLLTPAIFVVATIISFNFLGDGLRDAADPFSN
ncbi:ABC transporter permease [Chloroflexi bacterium TSY]|nr:ABC transporter permease [Chloroflexi bacterium TSY]